MCVCVCVCVCVFVAALQALSFYNLFKPSFTEHWLWARICANFKQICILEKNQVYIFLNCVVINAFSIILILVKITTKLLFFSSYKF